MQRTAISMRSSACFVLGSLLLSCGRDPTLPQVEGVALSAAVTVDASPCEVGERAVEAMPDRHDVGEQPKGMIGLPPELVPKTRARPKARRVSGREFLVAQRMRVEADAKQVARISQDIGDIRGMLEQRLLARHRKRARHFRWKIDKAPTRRVGDWEAWVLLEKKYGSVHR